jgi:D-glycero-D-manno-heptose 1,7-bisphosphate phosphatase
MNPKPSGRVVVLDRDGTIVIDKHYLDNPDELEFLPNATAGLRLMHDAGCRLIVVTNQSGVGRGRFSLARMHEVNARLEQMVAAAGARLEAIYSCPHSPADSCSCRKPRTGMLQQAAAELGFEPSDAIVVGDKSSDIELGSTVGAVTILISGRDAVAPIHLHGADFVVRDLVQVAHIAADAKLLAQARAAR